MRLLKEAFNFVLSSAQEYSMNNGSGKKRIAAAFLYKARHSQNDD